MPQGSSMSAGVKPRQMAPSSARMPHLTGLMFDAVCIQAGMANSGIIAPPIIDMAAVHSLSDPRDRHSIDRAGEFPRCAMFSRRGQLHQRPSRLSITLLAFAVMACGAPSALAQTQRLHLPTVDGKEPDQSDAVAALSATGRHVVVWSGATNLVIDDTGCGIRNCSHIFVLDRDVDADGIFDEAGTTAIELVSRASDGTPANEESYAPTISADGRYVAFTSYASNLVPGDTVMDLDVFVHDRQTRRTEIVSVSSTGAKAAGGTDYYSAVISANGRVVAFRSGASNLVAGDTNRNCLSHPNCYDLFVHDRVTGCDHEGQRVHERCRGRPSELLPGRE